MTYQEIQNMIVDTFWSDALKVEIKRRNYVFPPDKLLSLAYKQAQNDTQALELMKLFADEVPEAADHARLVIAWMEDNLEKFRTVDKNTIFQVQIDPDGDDDTLDYICSTYETCLDVIDQFYRKSKWCKESENACATIIKHRFLRPGESIDLHRDQHLTLGPGRMIEYIPRETTCEYGECEFDCQDCSHPCVNSWADLFPEWVPDLSPVRYQRFKDVGYGCVLSVASTSWEGYVVPLDSGMFEDGLEEHSDFLDHDHIPWPNVEPISPDDLPEKFRRNYDAFVAYWKKLYPEQYAE